MKKVKLDQISDDFASLIERLREGNHRFVEVSIEAKDFNEQRKELVTGQKPEIIMLTCADSRVVPEYIFDKTIGELFVIREAGNVFGHVSLGSIEYAAGNLGSKIFMVLGHTHCGGVTAAIDGAEDTPFIKKIAEAVSPAVIITKAKGLPREETINETIRENVRLQMQKSVDTSNLLRELVEKGRLAIIGGIYDLETGKVEFLDDAIVA